MEIGEKMQNKGYYAIQGHPNSSRLVPIYRSLFLKFWTLCVFEPPFGGFRATYDVHLGLIGKRVVDLLVIIELFSLGVTAEVLRAKIDRKLAISLQRGHFKPKFQVQGDVLTNNFCMYS